MSVLESATGRDGLGFSQRARSEAFPASHIHGDFIYRRIRVNRKNSWLLRRKAKPFEDQLDYDEFISPREVIHNVRPGGEVTFVMPAGGKDKGKEIGVATREMRQGVLVTGVVVINKDYRKKDIGTHLAEDAVLRLKPIAVTGRTRRWEVYRIYESLEYQGERIIPVISPVDTDGRLPEEARRQLIVVLSPEERKLLDLEKGLYEHGTYPNIRDIRVLAPPRNNPEAARIFDFLVKQDISDRGTRYHGPTDQHVLDQASAAYNPREVVFFSVSPFDRLLAALSGIVFIPPAFKRV